MTETAQVKRVYHSEVLRLEEMVRRREQKVLDAKRKLAEAKARRSAAEKK